LVFSYRGFDELKGIEIAWNKEKVGSSQLALNEEGVRRLKAEAEILKNLRHKNIIRIYHSWVDWKTNDVNFVTEIFTHGNLLEYVHAPLKAPVSFMYSYR
jgi:WNK lysine deficient protein kinase